MIEIIATIWLVSCALSLIFTTLNYIAVGRLLRSHKLTVMNANLAKVGMFWSNVDGNLRPLSELSIEDDQRRAKRGALFLGFLALFSLPGLIFLMIIIISMRFLARSRKEKAAFHGPLATTQELGAEQVQLAVEQLQHVL